MSVLHCSGLNLFLQYLCNCNCAEKENCQCCYWTRDVEKGTPDSNLCGKVVAYDYRVQYWMNCGKLKYSHGLVKGRREKCL